MNEDSINEERKVLRTQTDRAMKLSLSNLRNPQHLYDLANLLKYRKEVDLIITVTEKLYQLTKNIDELRAVRAPIQKEIDALKAEEDQLALQKKQLTSIQIKRLQELEEQIKKLPEFPYFAQLFQYNQYHKLNLQIAQQAMEALLAQENQVEAEYKQKVVRANKITVWMNFIWFWMSCHRQLIQNQIKFIHTVLYIYFLTVL